MLEGMSPQLQSTSSPEVLKVLACVLERRSIHAECESRNDNSTIESESDGPLWLRVLRAGLGPFVFLAAIPTDSPKNASSDGVCNENNEVTLFLARPTHLEWSPLLWHSLCGPHLRLRCVGSRIISRGTLTMESGPPLSIQDGGIITLAAGQEVLGEEKSEISMSLPNLLEEASVWSAELVQQLTSKNGVLLLKDSEGIISCAMEAVRFVAQQSPVEKLLELILDWAAVMHDTLREQSKNTSNTNDDRNVKTNGGVNSHCNIGGVRVGQEVTVTVSEGTKRSSAPLHLLPERLTSLTSPPSQSSDVPILSLCAEALTQRTPQSDGADGFITTLLNQVSSHETQDTPFAQWVQQIRALNIYPSGDAIKQADLLYARMHDEVPVQFYELRPQMTSDIVANNAAASTGGGGSGEGHPCFLAITETDVILTSAFRRTSESAPPMSTSHHQDTTCTDAREPIMDKATTTWNDNNYSNKNNTSDDVRYMLAIPRIALMRVRVVDAVAPGGALQLQLRFCRNVWLSFYRKEAMKTALDILSLCVDEPHGNRLLASAHRSWRMAALTLIAGNVLPTPHMPFFKQVLQNLLISIAHIESRRSAKREVANPVNRTENKGESLSANPRESSHWWLYNPFTEYARQALPSRQWRLSRVNRGHTNFPSYPECFVVPNSLSEDALQCSTNFRTKGRVEALTFYYPPTNAGIVRSSQPASISILCATSSISPMDVFESYRRVSGMRLHFLDLRSSSSAVTNTLIGGGFTLSKDSRFCSLANIHDVRHAYNELCTDILDSNPSFPTVMRVAAIAAAGPISNGGWPSTFPSSIPSVTMPSSAVSTGKRAAWLNQVYALLRTAVTVARLVAGLPEEELLPPAGTSSAAHKTIQPSSIAETTSAVPEASCATVHLWTKAFATIPLSAPPPTSSFAPLQNRKAAQLVLLNCSDGWDRTPQVCALAQLLLDPYFRTAEGFVTLLEKEFVAFGHPCLTRASTLPSHSGNGSDSNRGGLETDGDWQKNSLQKPTHSPILLQFFDAVHNLLRLYPMCFEFTENFLLLIVDVMHAGILGTFTVDSEADVQKWSVENTTLSLSQFCAILLATAVTTDTNNDLNSMNNINTYSSSSSSNHQPQQHHTSNPSRYNMEGSRSPSTADISPPQSSSWCRRLPISRDAMDSSGLLNPHFCFLDNKVLMGPLVDALHPFDVSLWDAFFLRHVFWSERQLQLRQIRETSCHSVATPPTLWSASSETRTPPRHSTGPSEPHTMPRAASCTTLSAVRSDVVSPQPLHGARLVSTITAAATPQRERREYGTLLDEIDNAF